MIKSYYKQLYNNLKKNNKYLKNIIISNKIKIIINLKTII